MKSVVVLGIRSGTSMVAMVLDALGVYMGKEFRGPNAHNKKGFFEELDFVRMDRMVLKSINKDHYYQQPSTEDIMKVPLSIVYQVKETIEKHAREPIWGFKLPLTCFTLPVYNLLLKNPCYIICERDRQESADSLQRLEGKKHKQANFREIVEGFFKSVYRHTAGKECLVINYDDFLGNPKGGVGKLLQFLKFPVTDEQFKEAVSLVKPELRNFK